MDLRNAIRNKGRKLDFLRREPASKLFARMCLLVIDWQLVQCLGYIFKIRNSKSPGLKSLITSHLTTWEVGALNLEILHWHLNEVLTCGGRRGRHVMVVGRDFNLFTIWKKHCLGTFVDFWKTKLVHVKGNPNIELSMFCALSTLSQNYQHLKKKK